VQVIVVIYIPSVNTHHIPCLLSFRVIKFHAISFLTV
jgi:hypothetical protein